MNIHIHHHDLEMTDALRQYALSKIGQIEKYIAGHGNADLDIEIGKTSKHHKQGDHYLVKVNLKFGNRKIHIETVAADAYAAIDSAKDKLVEDVSEEKDKKNSVIRKIARQIKDSLKFGK